MFHHLQRSANENVVSERVACCPVYPKGKISHLRAFLRHSVRAFFLFPFPRQLQSLNDIRRISAGADADGDIASSKA